MANRTAVSGRTAPAIDRCGLRLDRWPSASHTYPTEENERIIGWLD